LKICKNNCIFCFISQLPKNLRSTLYIKDDDYFQSYTHGNFITLTNLSKKDIGHIIKFKIEPLHVSIHSFDREIRNKLFGNNKNFNAIDNLKTLDGNGIRTNLQIVLCPGINDGYDLENTLDKLTREFKKILSIGIVPVGITRYNKNAELESYNKSKSIILIEKIEKYKSKRYKNKNVKKIYLSDEFYVMADKEFPDYRDYGRFYQIQNGIGKSTYFIDEIKKNLSKKIESKLKNIYTNSIYNSILIVTSEYGIKVLKKALSLISGENKIKGLQPKSSVEFFVIKNDFFGGNVKVTGLLTGIDIINSLKRLDLTKYNRIFIPGCIFNKDGLTLDDFKIEDIKNIDKRIKIISETAGTLLMNYFK